jgi:anti-sigma factor RsiW
LKCEGLQDLLHGYMDGELDLLRNLEIEQHLQECAVCSATVARHQALRTALKEAVPYYRAPVRLQERIRSALQPASRPRLTFPGLTWRAWRVAAAVAFVALLAWGVVRLLSHPDAGDPLAEEVVSDHVRSLMPGNLLGVVSTNQHVVKPWFSDKVEFPPMVMDLSDKGFELAGGRLGYVDKRRVATVVYKRRAHIINVFQWPAAPGAESAPQTLSRQGFHIIHWTQGGLHCWAVSDLNERELAEFVQLMRN